jgi:hypothetical protein
VRYLALRLRSGDVLFLAFGIDHSKTAGDEIMAINLLLDLGLCYIL